MCIRDSFTDGRSQGEVDGQDIYETVREAIREPGRFSEIYLSGGTDFSGDPPFAAEAERYIRVLQAVGRNFSGRFSSQLMAPAYPKTLLRRIYDPTRVTSYCPNIAVWDAAIFKELCPGKEHWVGHAEWVRRTLDAVEIFGKGQVCTQVVLSLIHISLNLMVKTSVGKQFEQNDMICLWPKECFFT